DLSILDAETTQVDRAFFAPVMRFDAFITVKERWDLELLKRRVGFPIHTLEDLLKALQVEFEGARPLMVGVKIALAYRRSLHFDKATYAEAEAVFNRIQKQRVFRRLEIEGVRRTLPEPLSFEEAKPLQDFMVHRLLSLSSKHGLPVQVHTGLQEGNENLITNSHPALLTNLFMEYSEVNFDLFHASYPYSGELAVLAKNFPNVYADMCWLHVISPAAARNVLSEWIDAIPVSKILAFGGDYRFVEGAYAHAVMARENVARVLAEKVEEGAFTEAQAVRYAEMILRTNAQRLFSLPS
ncbi:MAG: amidohydrolase family protein, partial [Candidatus Bathyarchaeia archaeon]